MAVSTFAAIDIGSYEVSMKIFELSKKSGLKELNHVRYRLEIGKVAYSSGRLDREIVDSICEVLKDFRTIMMEFGTEDYRACATSAFREMVNPVIILEQIYQRTGIRVEILSNAEQHFLGYKSIAAIEAGFKKMIQKGTAILDVGGGSLQVSLFDKDALVTTQSLKMGSMRIRERLKELEKSHTHYDQLIPVSYTHLPAGNSSLRNLLFFFYLFCGCSCVLCFYSFPFLMTFQKQFALGKSLWMRINGPDIIQRTSRNPQKHVVYGNHLLSHNMKPIFCKKIINICYDSLGGILYGKDRIICPSGCSLLHCLPKGICMVAFDFLREISAHGRIAVSSLHSLEYYVDTFQWKLIYHLIIFFFSHSICGQKLVLAFSADRHNLLKNFLNTKRIKLPMSAGPQCIQFFPLSFRIQNLLARFNFILCDILTNLHSLFKKLKDLTVNLIYFFSAFLQICHVCFSFCKNVSPHCTVAL